MKKAFTLAEILIVFTAIGVLTACLLPAARRLMPNDDVAKFKSTHANIMTAIRTVTQDEKYFQNGNLTRMPNGTCVNSHYFLQALADVLEYKSIRFPEGSAEAFILPSCSEIEVFTPMSETLLEELKEGLDSTDTDNEYSPAKIMAKILGLVGGGAITLNNDVSLLVVPPKEDSLGFISAFFDPDIDVNGDGVWDGRDQTRLARRIGGVIEGGPILSFSYAIDREGRVITSKVVDEWVEKNIQGED